MRIQISNLRHSIQQERIQWDEQRRQEENGLKMRALQLEQRVAEKLGQADQLTTARLDAFQQAENERQAAVKERLLTQQERQTLGNLNTERVEVERFRLEVNRKHAEAMQHWTDAQAALNTANQRHDSVVKMLAEIERRTMELDQLRMALDAQKEDIETRSKHLNAVQDAIGQVIEKLPVPETPPQAPLPITPEQPPVTSLETPGVQEAEPSATLPEGLPSVPPLPGLSGDVEIAPLATSMAPTPSEIVLPGQPTVPYVHPSQRRVMDGTKPLNEQ